MLNSILSRVIPALFTTMSSPPSFSVAACSIAVGGVALTHVARDDERLDADRTDLLGSLLGGAGEVVEHHVGTRAGEGQGFGAAEPGAGAGDDGDASLEGQIVVLGGL